MELKMIRFASDRPILMKIFLSMFFLLFIGFYGSAQINYNYNFSKTETLNWFEFEPDEEFSLEGSDYFLEDASTVKFYPTVASFFSFYDNSSNSLGVKLSWSRLGSHYADIVPKKIQEDPFAYPVEGLESISIWLWSPGSEHEVAAIFKRSDGLVYSLKLAKLDFKGWRKFKVPVPVTVKHKINTIDLDKKYFFDRLRVYTSPRDKVGDVYIFMDKLEIVYELYSRIYDGLGIEEIIRKERQETTQQQRGETSQVDSSDDGADDSNSSAEENTGSN